MRFKASIFMCILFAVITSIGFSDKAPPPVNPYLNGIFPESTPGFGGSWDVINPYPDIRIPSPLRIIPFTGTNDHFVLSKIGEIWRVNFESQTQTLVLDIKENVLALGEEGMTGIVLHPNFGDDAYPENQYGLIFYRFKPNIEQWSELGYNRLSKVYWDSENNVFNKESEEILIQQYDRKTWHNGGGMFFGPDGFLYLSVGDEGDFDHIELSTQRLDGGLFSGLLRLDVDNDPSKSHPIRRQPRPNEAPRDPNWPITFSQGYSIPNDNPWLNEDGSILEEFYAIGIRSPYSMHYDRESDQIYLLDVGSDAREEINIVEYGDNLQWPYLEGSTSSPYFEKPTVIIGNEKTPIVEYGRSTGNAIIGGGIYRGEQFLTLRGKYIFGDFGSNKLMLMDPERVSNGEFDVLIADIRNQGISLPNNPGISGVHSLDNGEIIITVIGVDFTESGRFLSLQQKDVVNDPPDKLSDLGIFQDLDNLTPIEGIIPYTVNSPLWSDRAEKKRWIALPNLSTVEGETNSITFRENQPWSFPEGTVFIKHFELPLDLTNSDNNKKLETRFFVVGKEGEHYGLTYRWNDDGTEATLLRVAESEEIDIMDNGVFAFTQTWDYPSRDQCLTCHNSNANFVLGFNTHQLNCTMYYPEFNIEMNQLSFLDEQGLFNQSVRDPYTLPKSYALEDESVPLELRIRSYMDSNCANCHRSNGINRVDMDLRYSLPLSLHKTIGVDVKSEESTWGAEIIAPGEYENSELWIRDSSTESNRMPPIGRNLVDQVYIDSLEKWIGLLDESDGIISEFTMFPNPSQGFVSINFNSNWSVPITYALYDMTGRLVNKGITSEHSISIDIQGEESGSYIFTGSSGELSITQKLVLQ